MYVMVNKDINVLALIICTLVMTSQNKNKLNLKKNYLSVKYKLVSAQSRLN